MPHSLFWGLIWPKLRLSCSPCHLPPLVNQEHKDACSIDNLPHSHYGQTPQGELSPLLAQQDLPLLRSGCPIPPQCCPWFWFPKAEYETGPVVQPSLDVSREAWRNWVKELRTNCHAECQAKNPLRKVTSERDRISPFRYGPHAAGHKDSSGETSLTYRGWNLAFITKDWSWGLQYTWTSFLKSPFLRWLLNSAPHAHRSLSNSLRIYCPSPDSHLSFIIYCSFYFSLVFETGFCYVAQAGLKLRILPLQPP
jgi:hypothetical protein